LTLSVPDDGIPDMVVHTKLYISLCFYEVRLFYYLDVVKGDKLLIISIVVLWGQIK
jgi:hypothetical protein